MVKKFEFALELTQLPYYLLELGVVAMFGYIAAMILIGFPVSVWEHFTKKKVKKEAEGKVIFYATIFFTVIFVLLLLYEELN